MLLNRPNLKRFLANAATCAFVAAGAVSVSANTAFAQDSKQTLENIRIQGDIELQADQLTYDAETGEVTAVGRVLLVRDGYRLLAGSVRYNENTGEAEAVGAVELITPSGERLFAPSMGLNDQLKTAFIQDFQMLFADGSRVAAQSGEYAGEKGRSTLKRVAYSPCKICADKRDGEPLWQIKAVRVTHDRDKKRLYYKNAFLEILGVPVLWTPYFSHPDPTVDRASGFLPIDIKRRNELGLVLSTPYYYTIDESKDLTITPTLTTRESAVLAAEYRQHLGFGKFEVEGSITRTDRSLIFNRNQTGPLGENDSGGRENRGHIAARGELKHSDNWRSRFDLAWTSDDTYLRRYDFSDLDTLTSQYQLEGFFDRSYISARTIAFQGLRLEDDSGLTGHALPIIDAEYVSNFKPLGGRIKLHGNAAAITRFDGLDTQRASVSGTWERRWITEKGFVVDVSGLVRSDIYHTSDRDRPDDPAFGSTVDEDARLLARATGRIAWPLVSGGTGGTHTLEPILEVTVSPESGSIDGLVNEDSRAFELGELNLFGAERAPGYDLWEEGTRVTYGVNWRFDGDKISTDVLFGQSARITGSANQFPVGTGLEGDFSDFVGHTRFSYDDWLDIEHRYRLSDKDLEFRRNEIALAVDKKTWGFSANYLFLDRDLGVFSPAGSNFFINREDREEIQLSSFIKFDDNWQLSTFTIQDLTTGRNTIQYGGELLYRDECFEFGIEVKENFTVDRDFDPGTSVLFRIKLRNLG